MDKSVNYSIQLAPEISKISVKKDLITLILNYECSFRKLFFLYKTKKTGERDASCKPRLSRVDCI